MKLVFVASRVKKIYLGEQTFELISISVFHGEDEIGSAGFRLTDKSLIAEDVTEVHPEYRRNGIATAMYRWMEVVTGRKARPSKNQTRDAKNFWKGLRKKNVDWRRDTEWVFK